MTTQKAIFAIAAIATTFAAGLASAAPGDALVGEWREKNSSLQIMNINGSVTLHQGGGDPSTLDCDSEMTCSYETTMHERTHYVVQGDKLLVQAEPKDEAGLNPNGINPKKPYDSYRRIPPGIKPGRYKLNLIVEILSSKADGAKWDPMGDPPDPIVTATVYGAGKPRPITCRQKNTLTSDCLNGTVIDVDVNTMIEISLVDEDAVKHDKIGSIGRVWFAGSANKPEKAIRVTTSGPIKSATLILTPAP
jgi:hypothetical protein